MVSGITPHEESTGCKAGRDSEVETERILKKGDVRQVGQVLGQTRNWGEIGSGSTRVREETPESGNLQNMSAEPAKVDTS